MYEFLLKVAAIAPITIPLAALVALYGIKVQKKEKRLEKSLSFSHGLSENKLFQDSFKTLTVLLDNRLDKPLSEYATKEMSTDEANAIRSVLNELERMAAGVRYNIYDEEFLFSSLSTLVLNVHLHLKPYIKEVKKRNPFLYENLDYICLRWKIRRFKKNNKELVLNKNYKNTC